MGLSYMKNDKKREGKCRGHQEGWRQRRGEMIADGGGVEWRRDDDDIMKWAPVRRAWMNCVCMYVSAAPVGVFRVCHPAQHSSPLTQ